MPTVPRVAFFTDSYAEANGVARLSRALVAHATDQALPFLCVHGGDHTGMDEMQGDSPVRRLVLKRGAVRLRLEHDLSYDLLVWRHYRMVRDVLTTFRPDVIHITGPSDAGQLGAMLGHRLSIPIVGSWHTNLHQYAALRSQRWCRWLQHAPRERLLSEIERRSLDAALLFYRIPRVLLAPNADLVRLLAVRTGKPTHLMKHGVDTVEFAPRHRSQNGALLRVGFVGRLSAEKNVRLLADLASSLSGRGIACEFVIIGDGSERQWLETSIANARFPGVLTGQDLARAYASLDLFAFPSPSETFGLAVLEAMASGVAVLAMQHGGPGFVIQHGVTGWTASSDSDFINSGVNLATDAALRRRLARAARAAAKAWSWPAVAKNLYQVYQETVDAAAIREAPGRPIVASSTTMTHTRSSRSGRIS
ncbi:MAG TPA: glycosyltransferase [Vicinamibacterales bacterium]|jgi:glycosyltransferase involved in cell wall biosynthesis